MEKHLTNGGESPRIFFEKSKKTLRSWVFRCILKVKIRLRITRRGGQIRRTS